MNLDQNTRINCTYAEFPFMCRFTAQSFTRDLPTFTAHSPMFNSGFLTQFETRTEEMGEMIAPLVEVKLHKIITARLNATMTSLVKPVSKIGWYVEKAYADTHFSPYDFGIVALRKALQAKDADKVARSMQTVRNYIIIYGNELAMQGLNEDLIAIFSQAYADIIADMVERNNLKNNRRNLLQANKAVFAELYVMLLDIQKAGKLLYHDVDPVKESEYTFAQVMKSLRRTSRPATVIPPTIPGPVITPVV